MPRCWDRKGCALYLEEVPHRFSRIMPTSIEVAAFNGDPQLDLAIARQRGMGIRCCWATATGRSEGGRVSDSLYLHGPPSVPLCGSGDSALPLKKLFFHCAKNFRTSTARFALKCLSIREGDPFGRGCRSWPSPRR